VRPRFNCVKNCGVCCTLVGRFNIPAWDKEGKVKDRGDGICVNLDTATLRCNIYETRPRICRVEESAPRWLPLRLSFWVTEQFCHLARKVYTHA
jgi:Fe-S-cluster containining protein